MDKDSFFVVMDKDSNSVTESGQRQFLSCNGQRQQQRKKENENSLCILR